MDERNLERSISRMLDARIRLCVSRAAANRLTRGEAARRHALEGSPRLPGWLRGRSALKRLRMRSGDDPDTSRMEFPHPRYSLTHSGEWAVAAGTSDTTAAGIGVDLQVDQGPSNRMLNLYLGAGERTRLGTPGPLERIRLWTVKEALFKSYALNARTWFTHYTVRNPRAFAGEAILKNTRFRYASQPTSFGWLTVAIRLSAREGYGR